MNTRPGDNLGNTRGARDWLQNALTPQAPEPARTVIIDDRNPAHKAFDDTLRAMSRRNSYTEGDNGQ